MRFFWSFALRPRLCATGPEPLACGDRVATSWQTAKKHARSVTFLVSLGDTHFSGGGYVTRVLQPNSTSQQLHQAMFADGLARWPCVFICVAALFARCAQHWGVTTPSVAIQRHWPKKSDAEVTRRIDDCSDDATDSDAATDALARLADPPTRRTRLPRVPPWCAPRRGVWCLRRGYRRYGKALWRAPTYFCNRQRVYAPSSPEATSIPPHGPSADSRGRQCVCRLRRRWVGGRGR